MVNKELSFLADTIPQMIWISEPNGDPVHFNLYWHKYSGLSHEQSINKGWVRAIHHEDVELALKIWKYCIENGENFEVEFRLLRKEDNIYRWHIAKAAPMKDEKGNILKWYGSCIDIHEQKVKEQELRTARNELKEFKTLALEEMQKKSQMLNLLLCNMPVILYRMDSNGKITEMIGNGEKISNIKHSNEKIEKILFSKEDTSRILSCERIITKCILNNKEVFFENFCFPDNVSNSGIIGFAIDITEIKKAKIDAEIANAMKTKFLTNMSHEIRTPLNAIIGFADVLQKRTKIKTQERSEYLDNIITSGKVLLSLINDVLDLSKIEEGKLNIQQDSFYLKENIESCLKPYQTKAQEKGLSFNLKIDESIPEYVIGDSVRLKQILINLIANAIKFTSKGEIKIKVKKIAPDKNSECLIQISVIDSGIGIPAEKQDIIFENFVQAEDSTCTTYGGSGLGLAITRQLVTLMNGKIGVQSPVNSLNRGSKFWVELPFTIQTEKTNIKPEIDPQTYHFKSSLKILVVEDNLLNKQLASLILKDLGCDAKFANNGIEAVKEAKVNVYDLILMDIHMPKMNGYDATSQIRTFNKTIPIIGVTANAFKEDLEKCIDSGMNDHLIKPYNEKDIYLMISKWDKTIKSK